MTTYSNVNGVQYSLWSGKSEDPILEQDSCRIEEMYYNNRTGDIVLNFYDHQHPETWTRSLKSGGYIQIDHVNHDEDTTRLHAIDIPIKASKDWNEFVDSLPKFEE